MQNKSSITETTLYLIFGILTTALNVFTYVFCYKYLENITSNIIAWIVAVCFAFITNKKWVFVSNNWDSQTIFKEASTFFICRLFTCLLDILFMYLSVSLLHINHIVMKILSNILVIIINYIASKRIIFLRKDNKNILQTKRPAILLIIFASITIFRLLFNFIYGFRWPSEYVCSQNIFTYRYGFLPRALIGTVMQFIFGQNMYSYKANYLIAIGTGLLLLGWFIWKTSSSILKHQNLVVGALLFWYSLSIFSAYSSHEMGYYEQYGYILIILYIELLCNFKKKYFLFLGPILSVIAVLISETNLFVISPVLFFINLMETLEESEHLLKKNVIKNIIYYVPSGILGLICNKYQTSSYIIAKLLSDLRKYNPSYKYAAGLGKLMFQNRIYFDSQQRNDGSTYLPFSFEVIPWQIILFIVTVIGLVSLILLMSNHKPVLYLYLISILIMEIAAYSINFIALDLDRFRYCGVMMILYFSLYICLKNNIEIVTLLQNSRKELFTIIIIGTIFVGLMMDFRLSLFENSVYNKNFIILKETLTNFQQ